MNTQGWDYEATMGLVMLFLDAQTDEERIRFFDELKGKFCQHCGREKSGTCHCNNDE